MHWDHRIEVNHFEQPGNLFRLMSSAQQQVLFDNTARAMEHVSRLVRERHAANCAKADPRYGAGIAQALGLNEVLAAE